MTVPSSRRTISAPLDALALITAVHAEDSYAADVVLDGSDLRDLAVMLARIVCAVVEHAHRDHGCPHGVSDRLQYAGLRWTQEEVAL